MRFLVQSLTLAVALPSVALAFGTISLMGQNREHERITRAALSEFEPASLDLIAGKSGTFGGVGAPDDPRRGYLSKTEAHCDGGDYLAVKNYPQSRAEAQAVLERCRVWMFGELSAAVDAAKGLVAPSGNALSMDCTFDGKASGAKCQVLEHFGMALHVAQDFYSHTNWTDRADPGPTRAENPPGLAQSGRAAWIDPRKPAAFPKGLISGCFGSLPESAYCNYGGAVGFLGKNRVKHDFLNKDKGKIASDGRASAAKTARGKINDNFAHAVSAAIDDTRDKWSYFRERVVKVYGAADGAKIICAVRSDAPKSCS
jgi:hypothetical protein